MAKPVRPEELTGDPRRRRSLACSAASLLTDVAILGAGAAGMHLSICGVRLAAFYPVLLLALLAMAAAILAIAWGLASLRSPGGRARSSAPLLSMFAWVLAILTVYDVLTLPACLTTP